MLCKEKRVERSALRTYHADLPVPACGVVVRVGLVRRGAHRVLEGVAAQGHALVPLRVVILRAALLVHEQLVALAGEVGGRLGGVRQRVRRRLRLRGQIARVRFACLLLVRPGCRFLLRFLHSAITL